MRPSQSSALRWGAFALLFFFALGIAAEGFAQTKKGKSKQKKRPAAKKPKLPQSEHRVKIPVAAVNPATLNRVKIGAKRIDQLVDAGRQKLGVKANPKTTDEQFVRRIYLDVTGTIPTYRQVRTFLQSRDPEKRSRLIDRLLSSPGFASTSYNYWADILRLTDRPDPNIFAKPYNDWVKQAIRDNMPYDKMVHQMLTAEGKIWDNPAAGYMLRDSGMPLDSVNNTVRVFLGTRIGCAECHDHPFDHWTQRQFYEVAAFTYGVRTRLNRSDGVYKNGNPINRVRAELKKQDPSHKGNGAFVRLLRSNLYAVKNDAKRKLKLPHDYAYEDGKPNQVVKPSVLFGESAVEEGATPRETFANWLTSKENPRFAKAIANRLWKRAMGAGLIEPVDDIRDESEPENPALLEYLTTIIKYIDFDMQEFLRIIYNTEAYQRAASVESIADGEVYHFPGPMLRRMSAEQVWDSLLTLAVYYPDEFQLPSARNAAEIMDVDLVSVSASEAVAKGDQYEQTYGRKAQSAIRKKFGYKGQILARASELPAPLPANHFLRQFGQGDRELISGANADGSVPQILTMFNGPVTHMMLEEGSVIYDNVVRTKSPKERIDVIFLSVLGRRPTSADRSIAEREIKVAKNAGYGNVIWALINTREFLFIQ